MAPRYEGEPGTGVPGCCGFDGGAPPVGELTRLQIMRPVCRSQWQALDLAGESAEANSGVDTARHAKMAKTIDHHGEDGQVFDHLGRGTTKAR